MMRIIITLTATLAMAISADKNLRDPSIEAVKESGFSNDLVEVNFEDFTIIERAPEEASEPGFSHELADYNTLEKDTEEAPPKKVKACWKDGEPRGKGSLPNRSTKECPENQEKSMGLCYPRCGDKRVGFGPLCVDDCKATIYKSSSILFCCESEDLCAELMDDVSSKLPKAIAQLAIDIIKNPNDYGKVLRDFRAFLASSMKLRLPMCSKVEFPFLDDEVQLIEDQVAELTEEEHQEANVSTGEVIEDFEQESQDAEPNPIVSVS